MPELKDEMGAVVIEKTEVTVTATEEVIIAPEDAIKDSLSAVEQMTKAIEAENDMLEREFAKVKEPEQKPHKKHKYFYIGTFSAALSLIVMGVAMIIALNSPSGIVGALKISPVMLVFLGIEIFVAVYRNKHARLKFSIKSIILTVSLLALTSVLSIISATSTATGYEHEYAVERVRNIVEQDISKVLSDEKVKGVDVSVELYENKIYISPKDLSEGDRIDVTVNLSEADNTVITFAEKCHGIIGELDKLGYKFGTVKFIADDSVNRYTLDFNFLYHKDYTAEELASLVGYFGDNILDADIYDIEDETE